MALHRLEQVGEEGARALDAVGDHAAIGQRRAPARHHRSRCESGERIERRRPVGEMGVAAIGRRAVFDEVAGEDHIGVGHPGDDVARGVAAAEPHQSNFAAAQPDRGVVREGRGRPGQARTDRIGTLKEPREAADLARLVLLAALDGLAYGSLIFLVAVGLSLIFGVLGIVNVAHGSFYAIGAYLTIVLAPHIGFGGAIIASPVLVALIGILIRNSVILIVQIEHLRSEGMQAWRAVVEATEHRMRPIMLTA
eukprot:gene13858-biopygen14023